MSDYLRGEQAEYAPYRFKALDPAWIDCGSGYERAIVFEPGYRDTVPHRFGNHGMALRFMLRGPKGIAQFLMNAGWVPGQKDVRPAGYYPMGYDVGYHATVRQYDGQDAGQCGYSPGGRCYYDGSGLAADPVLAAFIAEGEPAVWRELRERHDGLLGPDDRDPVADAKYDERQRIARELRERADRIESGADR